MIFFASIVFFTEREKMYRIHVHIPFDMLTGYMENILKMRINLEIAFNARSLDKVKKWEFQKIISTFNYKPSITFHAPFMDLSAGALDEKIRKVSEKRILQVLNLSKVLHPALIVVHTGYEKWRYAGLYDKFFRSSKKTWKRIISEAEKLDIPIALENVFEEDTSLIKNLIQEIGSKKMGHCFDVGHFHIFGKIPIEKWFDDLGEFIMEVHLHDNRGKWDEHLAPGSGNIDFKTLFSLISKLPSKPILTLEAHSREDVEIGMEKIKRFIEAMDHKGGFSI